MVVDIANQNGVVAEPTQAAVGTGDASDSLLGGYGLIGMRERALAVGGSLRAAPEPDGTWRVRARLPIRAEQVPAATPVPVAAAPAEPVVGFDQAPVIKDERVEPVELVDPATGCVSDLRKLPAKLAREPSEREPDRGPARESV